MNNNKRLEQIRLIAIIIIFSAMEAYFNGDSSYLISKDIPQSVLYGLGTILALFVAERYVRKLVIPVVIFLLLFNFMANLQKYGVSVKDKTLQEVQAEFCQIHNWKKCQVQDTPSIGKEKVYPRFVSLNEMESLGWSHTQLKLYNADVPRLRTEWEKEKNDFEKRKSGIEKANKEFLALAPVKYSQFEKLSLSFSSLSTQETFWLVLRLVFGFFVSIMLVALFENLQRVMKPLEIEVRKVDSVEVEAIQKMALLKTDSHWKFRDPKNILKNFPMFPHEEGLRIIYEVRGKAIPQKPSKTPKQDVKGIEGSSKGETPLTTSNVVFFPKKLA
ncbi:MAG TPA: hypothetical protein PKD50_15770 [Leptospiraceae bacterium]|nr:hypothetical protein [Leptospiraceae bacterium]HNF57481.1 hypothetical protein [Leptospiraceae bacterium]